MISKQAGVHRIIFPRELGGRSLLGFCVALNRAAGQEVIDIDFAGSRWGTPFWYLMAASHINLFKSQNKSTKVVCSNFDHLTYPAHIGFFWAFGLPHGNPPGGAQGNERFLPITVISCRDLVAHAGIEGVPVGEVVEQHALTLSSVLCQGLSEDARETLTYCVREIMRNVVEHSESDRIAYCAQYYPARGIVEVGINDWGVGLRRSLEVNSDIVVSSDIDAVRLALMPGISGKGQIVRKLRDRGPWTNSGYGLYMTSRVCRSGGEYFLASGTGAVFLAGRDEVAVPWSHPGTAVRLVLGLGSGGSIGSLLDRFRREADEYCRGWSRVERLSASLASRMLASDFADRKR